MLLFETILNEFADQNIGALKRYLNMSEEEKVDDLAHNFFYLFPNFVKDNNINIDPDAIEDPYELQEKNPELFKKFGEWIISLVYNRDNDNYFLQAELPTWYHVSYNKIIKNQWLVHFTKDPFSIAQEGFTKGVYNLAQLGLTTWMSENEKKYGGYNFAVLAKEANSFYADKYGKNFVVFRASGVEIYHYGDNENQVIFYGNTARNIVPVVETDLYTIFNLKTDRPIFQTDNIQKAVQWVIKNYDQYRKVLSYK